MLTYMYMYMYIAFALLAHVHVYNYTCTLYMYVFNIHVHVQNVLVCGNIREPQLPMLQEPALTCIYVSLFWDWLALSVHHVHVHGLVPRAARGN